jgi:hypothetical protein
MMRPLLLLTCALLLAVLVNLADCGASTPYCTGTGASRTCSGNGQGGGGTPSIAPSTGPATLLHAPNVSYVGQYLAGLTGGVTQTQIQANVSVAEGAVTSTVAGGRALSTTDACVHTCALLYFDFMRVLGFDPVMEDPGNSPAFSECFSAWFLHTGSCTVANRVGPNPGASPYITNFANPDTSTLWKQCFTAQVNAANANKGLCNGTSPGAAGDSGIGRNYDNGDIIFSDTSSYTMNNLTQQVSSTLEIGADPALENALKTWIPAAARHANGSVYKIWINGVSRGANNGQDPSTAHSCHFVALADCQKLVGLAPNITCGVYEFWGQAGGGANIRFSDALVPFAVNSATNLIASGNCIAELSEVESQNFNGCPCPPGVVVETTPGRLLVYYDSYLLTYRPTSPYSEYSWLDVEDHEKGQSSTHLSSWPVQTLLPHGNMAIPITAYNQIGGNGGAGCPPEDNVGGIIPYLVPGSCGTTVTGGMTAGTYGNASSDCTVAGVSIGPCAWFFNLTNADFAVPTSFITTLGTDLSLTWNATTFQHQVDVGQGTATLADMVSGGTMTYNVLGYTSGTTVVPSDSGIIITP